MHSQNPVIANAQRRQGLATLGRLKERAVARRDAGQLTQAQYDSRLAELESRERSGN